MDPSRPYFFVRRHIDGFVRRPFWGLRMFWQRGRRGWCQEDTWSLDHFIARTLSGALAVNMDNLHGCPPRLVEGGDVDAGVVKWRAIQREMATGLAAYLINDERTPETDRALDLLREWFGDLWD